MVQIHLNLTAKPGHVTETIRALWSVVLSAQAESPDVRCAVWADAGRPDAVCYTEEWPDEVSLEQRVRSLPFLRLLAVMETAAEAPQLEFRLVSETRGLEYVREVRQAADQRDE
ncbi:MAG: hypothetical protein JXR77_07920 [Lentisphaeria bacterium]|nr:hypothetical protein [Lentisphaeria bacterium]